MPDLLRDIRDFHEKFQLAPSLDHVLPAELQRFRVKFLHEELEEYEAALAEGNLAKAFDALIDLTYVALGTAYLHNFPFAEGWSRVQEANMSKVRAARRDQSLRGTTFDVVKPAGWEPPILDDLIHAHLDHVDAFVKEEALLAAGGAE